MYSLSVLSLLKNIGPSELIIIGLVLVVLFGGSRIKNLAKGLGASSKELKNVKKEIDKTVSGTDDEEVTSKA